MEYQSTEEWNEGLWEMAKPIYMEAFAGDGGKPERIIRNMFQNKLCTLHLAFEEEEAVAMAIMGPISNVRILLIDYLAVRKDLRKKHIGMRFLNYLKDWALAQPNEFDSILIEVECEKKVENIRRIQFWQKCGFERIENYTHQYKMIPQPYQAMILHLRKGTPLSGKQLFTYIGSFHKKSFRKR